MSHDEGRLRGKLGGEDIICMMCVSFIFTMIVNTPDANVLFLVFMDLSAIATLVQTPSFNDTYHLT